MTKKEYLKFHEDFCKAMVEITKKKNADYSGSGDDPFSNFRQIGGLVQTPNVIEIGFLTRMSDKFSRIGSYISKGKLEVNDESVTDTLIDLANYSALLAGYLRSKYKFEHGPIDDSGEVECAGWPPSRRETK